MKIGRLSFAIVVLVLLLSCVAPMTYGATRENVRSAVSSGSHSVTSQKQYSILTGMTETELVLKDKSGNRIEGHMMEIAPGAAVTAKVSYPGYYKKGSTAESRKAFADSPVWSKKTTTGQAADFTAATGQPVIFAINTDNFITEATADGVLTVGQCCGHLIMEGNICQTTEHRARPFFAVLKDGSFAIRDANSDLSDVVEATSGRIYIVKDGKNVVDPAHSEELGLMPYNSIGLKKDGTVVVFQVDGRRSDSVGFTEMEMAEYLLAQGVYTALILDGGGSATFASARAGDSKMSVRNQPSDGTERALGSTLLFMSSQDHLFFDYSGGTVAQERYQSFTYRGNNYDMTSAWKPTAGTADSVSVDTTTGTLTLTKDAGNTLGYSYVQTQASSGKALGFRPDYADYLQIRMKLSGFDPAASNTVFSIHYYADGASTQTTNAVRYNFGAGHVFDGSSILLTLPVAQKFRNAELIDTLKINFGNLTGGGTIEIDYLYIGPKASLPEQDYLYFDFQGTAMDARRYASKTYSSLNYDAGGWGYNGKKSSEPVLGEDAMSFDVLPTTDNYVNTGHSPYIHTVDRDGSMTAPALCYRPGERDYFQIRFRMKDCAGVSGLTPMVRFYFAADGSSSFVGNVKKDLTAAEMTSDTYYVVTLPLYTNSAYRGINVLDYFRLNFQNVCAAEGKTGKITIDYIYVGPQESLPQQDRLFMDFTDDDAAELRYRSKTYGFQNYDQGAWAYNAKKCEKPTFSNGSMVITIAPTTDNYVNTGHSPYFQTSDVNAALSRSVLRYKPGTQDVVQVRFKTENCMAVPGKTAMLRFFYTNDDSSSTAGYVHRNLTATEISSSNYLTVTLPLYTAEAYVNSEYIRRIQITMQNLCSAEGKTGKVLLDYIYVGPESGVPTPQYTVTFVGADGKTLQTTTVHKGESVTYIGATPTKAYDSTNHYSFTGWDKVLTNISADITVTAQFTPTAHSYTYNSVDSANHKGTCSCGATVTVAHSWNSGTVTTAATCTVAGVKTYTCSVCKGTKTETIKAPGHSYTTTVTEATCTAQGYTTYTCSKCSYSYSGDYVGAKGHSYTTKVTQATCTAQGYTTYTCSRCNHSYRDQYTDATGHDYIYAVTKDPTVKVTGTLTGTCSKCLKATTVTLPKLSETDYTLTILRETTCTSAGYEIYQWKTVTYGTYSFTVEPAAMGHAYKAEIVEPTCTLNGYTRHTCTRCGDTFSDHYTNVNPHSYVYTKVNGLVHTETCLFCDLNRVVSHSYTDGNCACGEPEIKVPAELPGLKPGHTLNLASDISVNFAVSKTQLSGFDMDTVYILAEVDVYEGNTKVGTKSEKLLPVEQGNYYYFTLNGLTAIHMNDSIRSVIYGTKEGQPYYSPVDEYSIATYAYSQMTKAGVPENLKILCADLLRYGSAAQIYKEYRTDALADSAMTGEHRAFLSDIDAVTFGNTNRTLDDLTNASVKWVGKSLILDSKVCLKFIFSMGTYQGTASDLNLRVSYMDTYGHRTELILTNAELYNQKLNYYAFTLDTLLAAELRSVVSVQIYCGEIPVSSTLQYSADTYGNNKTGNLLELCKALFAYSDSAKNYFA